MRSTLARPALGRVAPQLPTFRPPSLTPPKEVRPVYTSPEYARWRDQVIERAGGRCEAIDNGIRCRKARPRHRLFADHKHELRDGGALFDPANGECLCGAHHSRKTAAARAARR
ncbi:MAG TPA: HNH endonuclease signature motif containing protein [Stellaceae bacterium]|nr:HNH endonuclease signature motif containing protein [Stellaceae bacterium]